jgi:hypothetical protein
MSDVTATIMKVLDRNLQSIWDGDAETYRATTADNVSFFNSASFYSALTNWTFTCGSYRFIKTWSGQRRPRQR